MHGCPRLTIAALLIAGALGFGLACASEEADDPIILDHGACEGFLACGIELAPESFEGFAVFFDSDGACWLSADQAQHCRDFCDDGLETLNTNAMMMLGEPACGTCTSTADCVDFGPGERCEDGLCKTTAEE